MQILEPLTEATQNMQKYVTHLRVFLTFQLEESCAAYVRCQFFQVP